MNDDEVILTARSVSFGFPQRPDFLQPIALEIERGQCWGIIGPNGAGKSTLLRLFAGLLTPRSGTLLFRGSPLFDWALRDRARRIAFLPQTPPRDIVMSAREVVLLGRYPHRQFALFENASDFQITEQAMTTTQTLEFADRSLATLSGGEAQRVHIAAALAQEPDLLLLDEPTAALDLFHQLSIFEIVQRLTKESRLAVVVVTHDVNLAARFCTHVLLLDDGRTIASGPPVDVITPRLLEPVYGVNLAALPVAGGGDWMVPTASTNAQNGGRS